MVLRARASKRRVDAPLRVLMLSPPAAPQSNRRGSPYESVVLLYRARPPGALNKKNATSALTYSYVLNEATFNVPIRKRPAASEQHHRDDGMERTRFEAFCFKPSCMSTRLSHRSNPSALHHQDFGNWISCPSSGNCTNSETIERQSTFVPNQRGRVSRCGGVVLRCQG